MVNTNGIIRVTKSMKDITTRPTEAGKVEKRQQCEPFTTVKLFNYVPEVIEKKHCCKEEAGKKMHGAPLEHVTTLE